MKTSAKKKNILFLTGTSSFAGGERMLINAIDKIDKAFMRPIFIVPSEGNLTKELKKRNIRYAVMNFDLTIIRRDPFRLIMLIVKLLCCLAINRIDIIHANNLSTYYAFRLLTLGLPFKVISHIHTPESEKDLTYAFKIRPLLIICCSKSIENFIRNMALPKLKDTAIITIRNATNTHNVPMADKDIQKKHLGLDKASHVITIIGDLSQLKGQLQFIEMANIVLHCLNNCLFVIIGEERIKANTGYRKTLENRVRELNIEDSVIFTGAINNVGEYIAASDIITLPSFKEGLPLVILEAMAHAKPVIATNIDGIPEAVINGHTGVLVDCGNVQQMAGSAIKLLQDDVLRSTMGKNGRKVAEELFGLDRYANDLRKVYSEHSN